MRQPYWKPTYNRTGEVLCFGKRDCTVFASGDGFRFVISGKFSDVEYGDIEDAKSAAEEALDEGLDDRLP